MESTSKVRHNKKRISITIDNQRLKDIDMIRGYVPRSTFIDKFFEKHLDIQTANQILRRNIK